ncbi:MAG: YdeI/OmpD-associated family protein [Gaiellaceae bacterium]
METGDRVHVEMRKLGNRLPQELEAVLNSHAKAGKAWNTLSAGERRDFVLFVADAKKSETRMRRARRLLGR